MKKLLPWFAFGSLLSAVASFLTPARAEDPKPPATDEDCFDNDTYGVKIWKPHAKPQWKIVGQGGWDKIFKDPDGAVFVLQKWAADNKDGDYQKSPPLVTIFAFRYGTQDKYKIGDWEGAPTSTKGFAKAVYKQKTQDEYKNIKNEQETEKVAYPCGAFYQFSCYGESKKYGGSHYLRVMFCKRDSKDTYHFQVDCAPGEEKMDDKHSGAEIEQILKSIKFYEVKKK